MTNGDLTLEFASTGTGAKAGVGILSAGRNGEAVHTRKIDLSDPAEREKALDAVCKALPGLDAETVRQQLEQLAGGCLDDARSGQGKKSQAKLLVELAEASGVELFHDGERAFVTVQVTARGDSRPHRETYPLTAAGFRTWLAGRFWREHTKAAGSQSMQDALNVLAAKALHDGPQKPVFIRVAGYEGAIYLDLCDQRWRAVKVTAKGWEVVEDPPVKFVRRRGMLPLPEPVRGGSVQELRPLVNVPDDGAWALVRAWLLATLLPAGPFPILALNGEQGSAKSTLSKMLRALVDPNKAPLRRPPRDDRDLMIAAANGWVVGYDNLSGIPAPLADSLCSLATGGGFGTRELYTDDEEKLFDAVRPVLVNGIDELATRPDLQDRTVAITLPAIAEADRRPEAELWAQFNAIRPRLLGALLDAAAAAMRNLPHVRLSGLPRMADFALWATAGEAALGLAEGEFMNAYTQNRSDAVGVAIEASPVGPAVLGLMSDQNRWHGTSEELLAELCSERRSDERTRKRQDWPQSPKAMSDKLRRLAPVLRRAGIEVTFGKRTSRSRPITLERVRQEASLPSLPSPDPLADALAAFAEPVEMTVCDGVAGVGQGEPSLDLHPQKDAGAPQNVAGDGGDDGDGSLQALSKTGKSAQAKAVIEL
jgi:hypothetical protein